MTSPRADVALAPLTTFELGGPARFLVEASSDDEIVEALRWAREHGESVTILGGGSNVVVADGGIPGLVVRIATRGIDLDRASGRLAVAAGEPWDDVVALAVSAGLAGLECLSGIPGRAGATPIQNVGAYGQEVAETITSVRVLDRATLEVREVGPAECAFAYRDSDFKRDPDRRIVLGVTFGLRPGGPPAMKYAELTRALGDPTAPPSLAQVRETVIALRRAKSMVIDPADENRRSAGSFFTNPIVPASQADHVLARASAMGLGDVPRWPAPADHTKLAAGWLIERAGIAKGLRRGQAGVSSRHALALVHHGGGTSAELLALAREVRARVIDVFGITLIPEPVFLGFEGNPL